MFIGCGTALVTPFKKDLSLDEATLRALVRRQIDAGINFVSPCGTTGESPTLARREHLRVVEIVVEEVKGRVPVLAGAGGYNTAEVVELAREVEQVGANGVLSVAPYYNKPSQEGLYLHYKAIAAAVKIPVALYNVPSRTGSNIEPATVARLAEIDNIVAVKEASGNIAQVGAILRAVPPRFLVISGDDSMSLALIALGGHGLISVTSNEIPAEMTRLVQAALKSDFAAARELHRKYLPLMDVNFVESNPIPVKAAMGLMGLLDPVWRLPLVAPQSHNLARIETILGEFKLLAGRGAHVTS